MYEAITPREPYFAPFEGEGNTLRESLTSVVGDIPGISELVDQDARVPSSMWYAVCMCPAPQGVPLFSSRSFDIKDNPVVCVICNKMELRSSMESLAVKREKREFRESALADMSRIAPVRQKCPWGSTPGASLEVKEPGPGMEFVRGVNHELQQFRAARDNPSEASSMFTQTSFNLGEHAYAPDSANRRTYEELEDSAVAQYKAVMELMGDYALARSEDLGSMLARQKVVLEGVIKQFREEQVYFNAQWNQSLAGLSDQARWVQGLRHEVRQLHADGLDMRLLAESLSLIHI